MSTSEPVLNLADLWELVVDQPGVADRVALVVDDRISTYGEFEERANRLAAVLAAAGIGPGDHVGCYLYNGPEYIETMLAAFKLRAVPINVNYRYVADELRYLCADAGLRAIVHDVEFADRFDAIRGDLPDLALALAVGGGGDYEPALAGAPGDRVDVERSPDDHYIVYTGGTTGMPKGVVWRHEDAFYACFGGGDWMRIDPVKEPRQILDRIQPDDQQVSFLAIAPLMHGAAQWTTFAMLLAGGKNLLTASRPTTDYAKVWRLITQHEANVVTIIGDAVARPLIDEYLAGREPRGYDGSSIFSFGSGAVPFSEAGKAELAAVFPNTIINDGYGASETGAQARNLGGGKFASFDTETTVLDPVTLEEIQPGSGGEGRVARRGHIPLRYHNDPEKSAATFVERDGVRWVLTGDVATVLDDGSIQLFGRGSMCINTGGEKVYPEEVEAVLVAHPDVYDVLVVGVDDPRWGQSVAAVVAPVAGAAADQVALEAHAREKLAGYKLPRRWVFVEHVQRSPSGKADYAWAKQTAVAAG
ncbi:MAG: acyl-CoA synthetase [Actinomycetota bacterium]|nr:acyl-CoA synthetase [Acidimicrobiia bacterium]MDQ3294238.1 acyl-CoA synthetase [Actinomycetota bacterium]